MKTKSFLLLVTAFFPFLFMGCDSVKYLANKINSTNSEDKSMSTIDNEITKRHKQRPTKEPFDPIDRIPQNYTRINHPEIKDKFPITYNPNTSLFSEAYLLKKLRREISFNLSYPNDLKGNYFRYRKTNPMTKIGLINSLDTCYVVKYSINEVIDQKPYHLNIVLDHSGSMGEERCIELQDALSSVLKQSNKENKVSIIKFDDLVSFEGKSNSNSTVLNLLTQKRGMDGFGGSTSIFDALDVAIDSAKTEKSYRNIIILFSDGYENSSVNQNIISIVEKSKKLDIPIFTIAFGDGADKELLKSIADESNGLFFMSYDRNEFQSVFLNHLFLLQHYYEIKMIPCSFDYDKILIEGVTEQGITVRTTKNLKGFQETLALYLNFDNDKSTLNEKYLPEIDKIAHYLKSNPGLKIIISGHTDNQGSQDYNLQLSIKRAESIKSALIKKGINKSRIQAIGRGESEPLAPNDSEENRFKNRRIEIEIYKN